jgi:uncharacterized heparinase superfamily protein
MAKISARGTTKIAQASKSWTDEAGYKHKQRLALRSDGRVLKAHDLLSPTMAQYGSRGWNRGSYSIVPNVKLEPATSARFAQYLSTLTGFEMS